VDAPKSVKVFRQEVFDAIKAENKAASQSAAVLPELDIALDSKRDVPSALL
ncbi:MAG: carbon storage regulator, partial [Treponema sp.]|nr:carbon storage regulator [Treponema sp.]